MAETQKRLWIIVKSNLKSLWIVTIHDNPSNPFGQHSIPIIYDWFLVQYLTAVQNKRDQSDLSNKKQKNHQQLGWASWASKDTLESHRLDHPDFLKGI